MTTHKWSRVDSSARFQYPTFTRGMDSTGESSSSFFNNIGSYCLCWKLVWRFFRRRNRLAFFKSVRSLLDRLCRFLPWTTLSYPSRSWMDRRNSIRLFRNHSYLCPFKVKGFKHFTPSHPPKKSELYIFFPFTCLQKNARNFVKVAKTKEITVDVFNN